MSDIVDPPTHGSGTSSPPRVGSVASESSVPRHLHRVTEFNDMLRVDDVNSNTAEFEGTPDWTARDFLMFLFSDIARAPTHMSIIKALEHCELDDWHGLSSHPSKAFAKVHYIGAKGEKVYLKSKELLTIHLIRRFMFYLVSQRRITHPYNFWRDEVHEDHYSWMNFKYVPGSI